MCDPCESNSGRKKRFIIQRQAREMAIRVLQMCIEEKKEQKLTFPLNKALDRAVNYSGLSKRTLTMIQKEALKGPLRTPSRKGGKCDKKNNIKVSDHDRSVIRQCIEEFKLTKNAPTCPKLLAAVKAKIHFPWGVTSLRKLLKEMGYQWQKCDNEQRISVEGPEAVFENSQELDKNSPTPMNPMVQIKQETVLLSPVIQIKQETCPLNPTIHLKQETVSVDPAIQIKQEPVSLNPTIQIKPEIVYLNPTIQTKQETDSLNPMIEIKPEIVYLNPTIQIKAETFSL